MSRKKRKGKGSGLILTLRQCADLTDRSIVIGLNNASITFHRLVALSTATDAHQKVTGKTKRGPPPKVWAAQLEVRHPADVPLLPLNRRQRPFITPDPEQLGIINDLSEGGDNVLAEHEKLKELLLQEGDWFALGKLFCTVLKLRTDEGGFIVLSFEDLSPQAKKGSPVLVLRRSFYEAKIGLLEAATAAFEKGAVVYWIKPTEPLTVYRGKVLECCFPSKLGADADAVPVRIDEVECTRAQPGKASLTDWRPSTTSSVVKPSGLLSRTLEEVWARQGPGEPPKQLEKQA